MTSDVVQVKVRARQKVLLTAVLGEWISSRELSCLLEVSKDGVLESREPKLLLVGSASVDGIWSGWSV